MSRDKRDIQLEPFACSRPTSTARRRVFGGLAGGRSGRPPAASSSRNEEMLRLVDALARLPDRMREVVVLKHCQGWTLQRIADHIGRSVPAVASLLRRGLADLRQDLENH